MARALPPLWLHRPSRFAGLSLAHARIGVALLALLLLACLSVALVPAPAAGSGPSGQTDVVLYDTIVSGIRAGESYYAAAADALRSGSYPLRPFLTFRMPVLAVVQGWLPESLMLGLLFALAAGVAIAWFGRLRPALQRRLPMAVAMFCLAAGMLAFVQPGLIVFHEIWAALLIALSLALRRPQHWIEAVAVALIAMLVRETAALYVMVMLVLAWIEGERREAFGWAAALLVFALALTAHAYAVLQVTGPLDPQSPGWSGLNGFGFFVKSLVLATSLQLLPTVAAGLVVGLALFGWASWRDSLAVRVLATIAAYALLIALFARADTFYWGLMIAPLSLVGLVFVPDGLRDLWRAALDKPRITVTRVAR